MYPWYIPLWARLLFFTARTHVIFFPAFVFCVLRVYVYTAAVPVSFLLPEVLQKKRKHGDEKIYWLKDVSAYKCELGSV